MLQLVDIGFVRTVGVSEFLEECCLFPFPTVLFPFFRHYYQGDFKVKQLLVVKAFVQTQALNSPMSVLIQQGVNIFIVDTIVLFFYKYRYKLIISFKVPESTRISTFPSQDGSARENSPPLAIEC